MNSPSRFRKRPDKKMRNRNAVFRSQDESLKFKAHVEQHGARNILEYKVGTKNGEVTAWVVEYRAGKDYLSIPYL